MRVYLFLLPTDSQIMAALKKGESGLSPPDICREMGISSAIYDKWRAGLDAQPPPRAPARGQMAF
jgi:hypothetical protein